jgi:hypothetical protein
MINYKMRETWVLQSPPLKGTPSSVLFSATPAMPSYFSFLSNFIHFLGLVFLQTLSIQHMPTTVSNKNHINLNFLCKFFLLFSIVKEEVYNQPNTYLSSLCFFIHMFVSLTQLTVFLDIPIVCMIPVNK